MTAKTIITTNIRDHLALIRKVPFFKHLTLAEATRFLQEKAKLVSYQGNEIIFNEGDAGDCMYIVVSGAISLFLRDTQSGNRRLTMSLDTIKKGGYFGERSLTSGEDAVRAASAKAIVTSTLLRIARDGFATVLQQKDKNNKASVELEPERDFEVIDLLRTTRLFQCMEMDETMHYRDWSQVIALSASERLFTENVPSNCLYFVIDGIIDIYLIRNGMTQRLTKIAAGQYFGEQSIMPGVNAKRTANARAETDALLLHISKRQFHKILQRDRKLEQALSLIGQKQAIYRKRLPVDNRLQR